MEKINVFKNNLQLLCSEIPPTFLERGVYCSEIAERGQICAINSLFEIFKNNKNTIF